MRVFKALGEILAPYEKLGLINSSAYPEDLPILRISSPQHAIEGDLVFVWEQKALSELIQTDASCLIVSEALVEFLPVTSGRPVILTPKADLLLAYIYRDLGREVMGQAKESASLIHPTAVIGENCTIPDSCRIGAYSQIGSNVTLSRNVEIGPHVVVEDDCDIGEETYIEAFVFVGRETKIGRRVHIQPSSVIGSEGFGFAFDERAYHRLPHLGNVVIEDDVAIGAQCAVDRAKFDSTRIGRGTKLDNQCHIAHNVSIGEDSVITAQFCVAGSTKIGDRFRASGQTAIHPHLEIADDVNLAFRAGVTDSIETKGTYAGLPLVPLNQYLKYSTHLKKLPEMKKDLRRFDRRISSLEGE